MVANADNTFFLDSTFLIFCIEKGSSFEATLEKVKSLGNIVMDVKTLQEVVYRYHLLGETKIGYENAMLLRSAAKVFPVQKVDLLLLDEWIEVFPNISPRELIHLAVMKNNSIDAIVSRPQSKYENFPNIKNLNLLSKVLDNI